MERLARHMLKLTLGLALLVSLLGAGRAHAESTPVTCGDVISAPGKYYLAADCEGAGITIAASNVDLNLNGHTLATDGFYTGIWVVGASNVNIHDGRILGQGNGVYLDHTASCLVTNVTVQYLGSTTSTAFSIEEGTGNRFDSNSALLIAGADTGFRITGLSYGNTISNNTSDGGYVGIWSGGYNSTIRGNTISNCIDYAIFETGGGSNTFIGNSVTGSLPHVGIKMYYTSSATIRENTLSGLHVGAWIESSGLLKFVRNNLAGTYYGVLMYGSGNRFESNIVSAQDYGIYLWPGSTNNTIKLNTVQSSIYDLYDSNPGPPLPNTWVDNIFNTTNYPGVIH